MEIAIIVIVGVTACFLLAIIFKVLELVFTALLTIVNTVNMIIDPLLKMFQKETKKETKPLRLQSVLKKLQVPNTLKDNKNNTSPSVKPLEISSAKPRNQLSI